MSVDTAVKAFFGNWIVVTISAIIWILSLCILFCSKKARFHVPINYTLLFIATAGFASLIASISSLSEPAIVLVTIYGICVALIFLFGTAFVVNSVCKLERSLFIALGISCIASFLLPYPIIMIFLNKTTNVWSIGLLGMLVSLIIGVYVLVDIFHVIDAAWIAQDEYILVAELLYIHIMYLFVYLLALFASD